ncbi:sensor domain-containing diguanylate cyclase [[Clostridium] symbiosum]|uniref:sensor domain-containing diguanylate cyclase n=1 Tax=Clostridium symbiosum TaxID=1512 RepID=UPI001D089C5A|nr:sensor domain-containing diguanylate cyclase [[Clostridium] symbiosum]MCB6609694.1 sensor domain-containing diguanylate cyclase [[Clostridium] symbiosum]MCB6931960.1 sensor domain-containing diguanylate cyclase [[Clostridium] symbiosum]
MEEKVKYSRYRTILFAVAVTAFCVLIYTIFINYGTKVNKRFMSIEKENLMEYGEAQSIKISEELTNMKVRLKSVAGFAGASSFDVESEEFKQYLSHVNGTQNFPFAYVSAKVWEERSGQPDLKPEEREFYIRLLEGKPAVSKLIYSPSRSGYYFFAGEPVIRNGETAGVIKCAVSVSELMNMLEGYSGMRGTMVSCIADGNGSILYCSDKEEWVGQNICDILESAKNKMEGIDEFIRAIEQNLNITLTVDTGTDSVFLTNIPMGFEGWNLMSFSDANLMKDVSSQLLDDTILMGMSLVGLTLLAGLFIYILMIESGRRIKLEQARYAALSNFSDTILFEYNFKTDVLQLTQNATELLGVVRHSIEKFSSFCGGLVHPDDVQETVESIASVRTDGELKVVELRLLGRDGGWIWCECKMQPISGNKDIVIGKLTDITGRKAKEMNLLSLSSTDTLTGLMNREAFVGKVESLIEEKQKGFFFMIDVDNFKLVNDTKGHEAGDGYLTRIGELLRQSFRDYDPVARIGGDEFAAFMSDTSDIENAQKKAELILSKMSHSQGETEVGMSVSIGVAACPFDGRTYQELYRNADHAMYMAKREGKNRFVCHRAQEAEASVSE